MEKNNKLILNVLGYLVVFIAVQFVVSLVALYLGDSIKYPPSASAKALTLSASAKALTLSSVVSSVIIIALFVWLKWAPISRNYIQQKPWDVLVWTILAGMGAILPLQWLYEQMNITMSDDVKHLFESIMGSRWGYLALGILAPVAEELVFRGAILRSLMAYFNYRLPWIPIVVSALLFGVVHGNVAQFANAFVMGLLLGWLYCRTHSIVLGVALHWVNNTVAYAMYKLMPEMNDGQLIDLFHGDNKLMYMGLFCSLLVLLPSLFQLNKRMTTGRKMPSGTPKN
ncbi:MAG: CPBP family intramembrane glutamic endopeptidase [Prevotella sp.]